MRSIKRKRGIEIQPQSDLQKIKAQDTELRIKWLKKLNIAIGLSMNEELPCVTRSTIMREPIGLSD